MIDVKHQPTWNIMFKAVKEDIEKQRKAFEESIATQKALYDSLLACCPHEGLQERYGSDTGNYDRSCDCSWVTYTCPHCNKSWTEYSK